jgi:hypothetical protein
VPAKRRPTGKTIDVDRITSVGGDHETGGAVIRLKDADGCTIALRLWKRRLRISGSSRGRGFASAVATPSCGP